MVFDFRLGNPTWIRFNAINVKRKSNAISRRREGGTREDTERENRDTKNTQLLHYKVPLSRNNNNSIQAAAIK